MMSSYTTENTSEIPINNRPTFKPNKHYYYTHCDEHGEALICVKVDRRSQSGKSIWYDGKYYKIKNDEKGEYIIYYRHSYKAKVYAVDAVFKNNDYTAHLFKEGFVNVLQKVKWVGESYTNFIRHLHNMLLQFNNVFVGFIEDTQVTLTTKEYVFQILEKVEGFKQEISDNNYKTVVDLLQKIHNV